MGIYLAHRVTGSRCYGTRVNARPHFCGFQGLAWICLTRITFKGVLFSLSFCPPSDKLTPKFQQIRAHVAMPTPVRLASRQKWAGPISAPPADAGTFE